MTRAVCKSGFRRLAMALSPRSRREGKDEGLRRRQGIPDVAPSPHPPAGTFCPYLRGEGGLQLAVLGVGFAVIGEAGGDDLVGQHAVGILDHLADIKILDRMVVRVELELAAHRLEL